MPQTRVRVVGSGFTTLQYNGQNIAFLSSFDDSGQKPIGTNGVASAPVYSLDSKRPIEIVTSSVLGAGTITATITELWNEPVWYQLAGLAGRRTITDVWQAIAQSPASVTCRMVIRPPNAPPRGKIYHGCVVTAIPDGESVELGTLNVVRQIVITYTHTTAI